MSGKKLLILFACATALTAYPLLAEDPAIAPAPTLEGQFQDPPNSARPRVWWHWMNGNITKEGIEKDLAWMKRVGIGGLQNFDANLQTPQVVDKRLVYMTPEWKDAFRFAAGESDRLGLELAIAASPGWSETGGPWVKPQDGLKKLVWSETEVVGGKPFKGTLAAPPSVTGPFQSLPMQGSLGELMQGSKREVEEAIHYGDIKVLAFPVAAMSVLEPVAGHDGSGKMLEVSRLSDDELQSGVDIAREGEGKNPSLVLDYGKPVTARTISLFAPGAAMMFAGALYAPRLEASDNGTDWRKVLDFETSQVTATHSFPAVTARYFRVEFPPKQRVGIQLGAAAPGIAMDISFAEQLGKAILSRPFTIGDLRLFGDPRVDQFETKAGFTIASDYYALTGPADRASGISPGSVIDLTDRMRSDGSLDWTPPKGKWRVLRLGYSLLGTTNHPAPPEATGLEVDKFDGDAVRRYIEHYLGMYREAAGGLGDKGVDALLTDSIEVGAANWTPKMIAQFQRLRGYDPTPWLPALTGELVGTRDQSDRFLYDYRRTLADLMASEHYGTVAAVAHENGLKVYGEALEDHRPSLGDDMAMRRYADVPMSAMWTHTREEGPKPTYLADIKGAASVAHIYGQNLVAAESLTASMNPWNYAPRDLRRVIDLEFVTGVNRPVIHTSVHVPVEDRKPGLSLFIFGQYFNRNETWAELAKPWVDYIARNSYLLQQGRNVADVGYFFGEEGPLTALFGDHAVTDAPIANAYDFVDADALMTSLANDGEDLVTPGGARYRALYLGGSSFKMTLATLRRLASLVENGATVIGTAPTDDPGLNSDAAEYAALVEKLWPGSDMAQVGKGRVIALDDVKAGLRAIGVAPDFRFTGGGEGADIPFLHRRLPDGDSYFLVNRKNRPERIEAHFRVTGKAPRLWHADTGLVEPVSYRIEKGETIVPLDLAAEESIHLVFREAATVETLTLDKPATVEFASLDGPWDVSFQEGRGAPPEAKFDELKPLDENDEPGIRYFSGVAAYTRDFSAPRGWKKGKPLWLDLGEVRELAEVRVNGKEVGGIWHAPFRIDIGSAVKSGRNTLEVRVANLWVNRLIGDAQEGATKVTWTAMPTYRADAPLRRSGLIGPVRLFGEGN